MGSLVISKSVLEQANISALELRLEIAIFLYGKERLTIGQARRLAELDLVSFQKELAKREVYIHFDSEDLRTDTESPQVLLEGNPKPHFLADLIGSMAGPEGDELAEIVSREFQQIEGKW